MKFKYKDEMKKYLPKDLLHKVKILLQNTGYVTISTVDLTGPDWHRFNEKVKQMGGLWVFEGARAHWSIPWS